jgi:hypothetical protein
MLDNELYTRDELNKKHCDKFNVTIDWKQCVERVHTLRKLKIHVLNDDVLILLKRLEDNVKLRKMLSAVKIKNKEGILLNDTIENIFGV